MRKIPEYLATSGKGTKNTQSKKGKMFGYQVLGFGAGGSKPPYEIQMMVVILLLLMQECLELKYSSLQMLRTTYKESKV